MDIKTGDCLVQRGSILENFLQCCHAALGGHLSKTKRYVYWIVISPILFFSVTMFYTTYLFADA